MFNIAIVDDEPEAIKILENYLARFSKENGCEFHYASYKNPVAFLENSKQAYDLVFLDIEMPDMSGMDAARKFREYNVSSALIFVTNMAQYAIEGYSVNADDFIVKPISYYDFAMKLARVLNKLNRREVEKVTDTNGLTAVKVSFASGILFDFNSSALSNEAKASLRELAQILRDDPTTDIAIIGHTDKVGTYEANVKVSKDRAYSVENYLQDCNVSPAQFKVVKGVAYDEYDETRTAEWNRRVEIYMYASEEMIQQAEAQN